jgi:hypothetical protein
LWGADSEAAEKVNSKRLLVAQALLPVLVLLPLSSMHNQEWLRYSNFSVASSAPPQVAWIQGGFTVRGKLLSFVGRAFRHDINSALSSGVSTPEGAKLYFSASCLAAAPSLGDLPRELSTPPSA